MPVLKDNVRIVVEPINRYGRVNLTIGSKRHSLTPKELMRVRDTINAHFFFEGEGVSGEDYVPEGK